MLAHFLNRVHVILDFVGIPVAEMRQANVAGLTGDGNLCVTGDPAGRLRAKDQPSLVLHPFRTQQERNAQKLLRSTWRADQTVTRAVSRETGTVTPPEISRGRVEVAAQVDGCELRGCGVARWRRRGGQSHPMQRRSARSDGLKKRPAAKSLETVGAGAPALHWMGL